MNSFKLYILSIMKDERKTIDARIVGAFLFLGSLIYGIILKCILFLYDANILPSKKVSAKVISVGNITLGGTGKTPFTIMLAEKLKAMGKNVAVLTRGYGGDESHLLKARLSGIPVITDANRAEGAKRAIDEFGSDCIILDDGFQHRRLKRDLDIVLIDTTCPFGNMKLFPRGILREPLSRLKDADMVVLTKADMGSGNRSAIYPVLKSIRSDVKVAESFYKTDGLEKLSGKIVAADYIKGKRVALLAAIANPQYFEWMVKNLGADIAERFYYVDHHVYTKKDIDGVVKRCSSSCINIVITTEKDIMRSKENGSNGLSNLIKSLPEGKDIEFFSLTIDSAISRNEGDIVAGLRSICNS